MDSKILKICFITMMIGGFSTGISNAQSMAVNTPQDLAINRKKIDSLDNQLIKTLGERERIVKEIGIYKTKNHIAPLQAARFKEVLDKAVAKGAKEALSAQFVTELMNAIHEESLRIERDSTVVKQ
jgi:chorismate mutase